MKKYIFTFAFAAMVHLAFGQGEQPSSKSAADGFERNYNAAEFDSIFVRFDANMQNALPLPKTREFLEGLQKQAGKITKREFLRNEQSYALYKTTFEKGVFVLSIAVDENSKISGLYVKPYVENKGPKLERNKTAMALPFKGEWTVVWGGDTKELNYHVVSQAQKNAFDILIVDETGKSYKTDGKTNADYYAFGKEIIAPCNAEVVLVVDGVKDNVPEVKNPIYVPGNTVILKTENDEFLLFAHFKQHSIAVKQGQRVKSGQLLGLCGNSGNSTEAHVHFHIQNMEDMNFATGVKCYFEKLLVNGEVRTDYSPIQNDKISQAAK